MPKLTRSMALVNKKGLHARAAALFVQTASGFDSRITVRLGQREVNGKSIMGLMILAAPMGTELVVVADGADAERAIEALADLVGDRFQEDE